VQRHENISVRPFSNSLYHPEGVTEDEELHIIINAVEESIREQSYSHLQVWKHSVQ
jgi:hypothetical protein